MKSVEELDVFKLAHELSLRIYRITGEFSKEEAFGLVSQMRRAGISICMNLVEGSMRPNRRDFRRFVGIARGSAAEVAYQLRLARDLGYLSAETYDKLEPEYTRVVQMLTRLLQSLDRE